MSFGRHPYVRGIGPRGQRPHRCLLMFVGESPGFFESRFGSPFNSRGASGRFLRTIAPKTRVPLGEAWITNLCKVRTVDKRGKDRAPTKGEIRAYEADLYDELRKVDPDIVVGLGATSSRWLLGAQWEDMETLHGVPHRVRLAGRDRVVVPSYHPAAGLHSPEMAAYFYYDMQRVGDIVAGRPVPFRKIDGPAHYATQRGASTRGAIVSELLGSDTEGYRWAPWSSQWSGMEGQGRLLRADDAEAMRWFRALLAKRLELHQLTRGSVCAAIVVNSENNRIVEAAPILRRFVGERLEALKGAPRWRDGDLKFVSSQPAHRIVLQSAAHDLIIYEDLGTPIPDDAFEDTAIMSYVLQIEPRGLKALAVRHCGMEMHSFAEITKPHDRRVALAYLDRVVENEERWPPAVGRKHSITKRARSIIASVEKPRTTKNAPKGPRARWDDIDKSLRAPVEAALGKMPRLTLDDCGPEFVDYACRDADATRRLHGILAPMVRQRGLQEVYELDRDVTPMLARMMRVGMRVDREKLGQFEAHLRGELREILYRCRDLADEPHFNPASTQQVGELLFHRLKLIPTRFTDGGLPSTNDQVLRSLLDRHPVVHWITEYREVQKLLSFVEKLWYEIEERGTPGNDRFYPILRTTAVVTGRLAAEGLNVLALPTHSKRAKLFKAIFVPDDGMTFFSVDADQIEFKIAADESGDPAMIKVFEDGVDMHTTTAAAIFGIDYAEVTRTEENATRYRTPAKITGFRVLYQGGAEGLLQQLESLGIKGYGLADCERFIRGFYDKYERWGTYVEECNRRTRRHGFIRARGGRIRYLPAIWAEDRYLRSKAERDAGNFPIQAGAQWVVKRAMQRLWPTLKELRASGVAADVLLQIHDDLFGQVPTRHVRFVGELVKEAMQGDSALFKVPITASVKFGASWGEMTKAKDWKPEGAKVAA